MSKDMSPKALRDWGAEFSKWIAYYVYGLGQEPVFPRVKPGDMTARLQQHAPEDGEPMDLIFHDFKDKIMPAVNHWNHPRFHAFFSVSASGPGILAEMLTAALNTNGMLWKSSPANTELEMVVMKWLREWIGLPESFFGMIHDTASTSTMHAIAAARMAADPDLREKGARQGLVLYTSEYAHSSVEKGALALGMGRENVRKIAADSEFRMRVDLLRKAIRDDLNAGKTPACVVSTAGTTAVTSVDPIREIQQVASSHGIWHHVDAAYGGSAAILPEMRWILDGAERADSLVMNPHKWLFTPMDCSAFYCRRPEVLQEAFALVPPYLRTEEDPRAINLMDYGVPLGRRFRALKLWMVMRYFGRKKAEAIIRSHIAWAKELTGWVEADERFEICAPTVFSLVCFRMKASDEVNQKLVDRINESGVAFLAGNVLNGQFVIRLAIGNIRTEHSDIEMVWQHIQALAGEVTNAGA